MPHIEWKQLPPPLRKHIRNRVTERAITEDDLVTLMNWISTNPEVPAGPWCKDFGSFNLVGHGSRPGTLRDQHQSCFGTGILTQPGAAIPRIQL
jgi:hypothetical protein